MPLFVSYWIYRAAPCSCFVVIMEKQLVKIGSIDIVENSLDNKMKQFNIHNNLIVKRSLTISMSSIHYLHKVKLYMVKVHQIFSSCTFCSLVSGTTMMVKTTLVRQTEEMEMCPKHKSFIMPSWVVYG